MAPIWILNSVKSVKSLVHPIVRGESKDYLETAVSDQNSFLHEKVDTNRLAAAGYSLGGATVLAASARDTRLKAVVALDPVYHEGGFSGEGDPVWDPAAEAPNIQRPTSAGTFAEKRPRYSPGRDYRFR